jgi:hypothetical protein
VPTISFTNQLERFLPAPTVEVEGATLREALDAVFAANPMLRGYVLDDQGSLRQHVAVFLNGVAAADRTGLTDPVAPQDEIHVLQALTGG